MPQVSYLQMTQLSTYLDLIQNSCLLNYSTILNELGNWLASNKLQLSNKKTKYIFFRPKTYVLRKGSKSLIVQSNC